MLSEWQHQARHQIHIRMLTWENDLADLAFAVVRGRIGNIEYWAMGRDIDRRKQIASDLFKMASG